LEEATETQRVAAADGKDSERRYAALVHSIDGIVWEVDAQTFRFIFVSEQAERILGYPREQWLEPDFWVGHLHPDDREWAVDFCLRATANRTDHELEYRMIAADGRHVWLRDIITVNVLRDQTVRLRGVMVDITERKRSERVLAESEQQYKSLFEYNTDAVYRFDLEGNFVSVNPACTALSGYTQEELLRMSFRDVMAPEDLGKTIRAFERAVAGEPQNMDLAIIHKDGRRLEVNASKIPILVDGNIIGVFGVAKDISERQRAEAALRESEERFRAQFKHIPIPTYLWRGIGDDLVLIDYNDAADVITQGRMVNYEGGLASDLYREVPEIASDLKRCLNEHVLIEKEISYRLITTGEAKQLSVSYVFVPTDLVMVHTEDITERKQAEEERLQLVRRLATAQEEERNRISRELHDQIGQYVPELKVRLKTLGGLCPDNDSVVKQLERLTQLADQIGQEVHSVAFQLRPTVLDDLGLDAALSHYIEQWSEHTKTVTGFHSNGFSGRRLPAEIETAIYRIAQEALTNVSKHAEAKGVSLVLTRTAESVRLIIEDNGKGFDAETMMMKASGTERRLGLLGMRERVMLVGGTLNIESTPGAGTTIYVKIPVQPDP